MPPELRKTDDYGAMIELGKRSGLEGDALTGIVAAYGFYIEKDLVGCVGLKLQDGHYSIECLAVDESKRHKGMGSELLKVVENEARSRGATRLYALARQPGFFKKKGYTKARLDEPGAPSMEGCLRCRQYGVSCRPEIVALDL